MSQLSRREFLAASVAVPLAAQSPFVLRSPDGRVEVHVKIEPRSAPLYSVRFDGQAVLEESRLGFRLDDGTVIASGWKPSQARRQRSRSSWQPPYGERSVIPDNFEEAVLDIETGSTAVPKLQLILRAYDEGAALRYRFVAGRKPVKIAAELTEFRFPEGSEAYEEHGTEGEYSRVAIPQIKPNCERPLTVVYPSGIFGSLTEAALDRYPRMLLSPSALTKGALASALSGVAEIEAPFETPWRMIVIGKRPGDLLERNYLVLNLNAPSAITDTSWIKPGKAIREVTLSTKGGKACVDFAVRHGLQYVEYDAGWYGHEYDDASDATTISPDPKRIANIPDHGGLDLHEVIPYARERGIGIFVYVNRRALERQLDVILPLYQKWGIKGVKFGFVNVGAQEWTTWLMDAVRKAAQYKLMVDIHDFYRPTGFSRTYPNLLTQEGIRGNEHMPTARHNATLPFTRYVAGAGDYTICYYTNRLKTTHAHQLALAATSYSPLQFLFWYDQPKAYQGEPEIEFFRHVPAVWDETHVIDGEIGEFATIARRKGKEWYIGSITNEQPREIEIPLSFLDNGRKYEAHIYADDPTVSTKTKVRITREDVTSKSVLRARLVASGGQAVRIAHDSGG